MLDNLCNNIENPLGFCTFTNFVNHVLRQAKTNRWELFVKICNYV